MAGVRAGDGMVDPVPVLVDVCADGVFVLSRVMAVWCYSYLNA
ncbi:MAG: hypothetical protein ACP5JB_06350 [candidate division WOR-3 bacterium]